MEEVKQYGSVSIVIDDSLVNYECVENCLKQIAAIRKRSIANEQQRKNEENRTTCQ